MNVTALVDTSGTVLERVVYDPYGNPTFYDGSWTSPSATSSYDNVVLYCGYHLDAETGLYHVRHRSYHPRLGRWMQRDPTGYRDSVSLYEYARGLPIRLVDPSGLASCSEENEGDTRCLVNTDPVFTPMGVSPDVKNAAFDGLDALGYIQLGQSLGSIGTSFTQGMVEGISEAAGALADKGIESAAGTGSIPKDIINAFDRVAQDLWGVDMYVYWRCDRCNCVEGWFWDSYEWEEEKKEPFKCDREKLQSRIDEKQEQGEDVFDPHELMPHQHPEGMGMHDRDVTPAGGANGNPNASSGYFSPADALLYLPACLEEAMKACEEECY